MRPPTRLASTDPDDRWKRTPEVDRWHGAHPMTNP